MSMNRDRGSLKTGVTRPKTSARGYNNLDLMSVAQQEVKKQNKIRTDAVLLNQH